MNIRFNMRYIYILLLLSLIFALPAGAAANMKNGGKVFYSVEKKHKFSSGKPDLFRISLSGKDTLHGIIKFQIISNKGSIIYKDEFPAVDLIRYGLSAGNKHQVTHKDSSSFVIEKMKRFFAEENFIFPAIKKEDVFDPSDSDKKIWDDIASDRKAIGFSYVVGEESNRHIAYSKRTGKVVLYRNYN